LAKLPRFRRVSRKKIGNGTREVAGVLEYWSVGVLAAAVGKEDSDSTELAEVLPDEASGL
jgi:hypothetical protein